jgi:hypothetical protein
MTVERLTTPEGVTEPSGVGRVNDQLIVVSDANPGAYYTYPLSADGSSPVLLLQPEKAVRHALAGGM